MNGLSFCRRLVSDYTGRNRRPRTVWPLACVRKRAKNTKKYPNLKKITRIIVRETDASWNVRSRYILAYNAMTSYSLKSYCKASTFVICYFQNYYFTTYNDIVYNINKQRISIHKYLNQNIINYYHNFYYNSIKELYKIGNHSIYK